MLSRGFLVDFRASACICSIPRGPQGPPTWNNPEDRQRSIAIKRDNSPINELRLEATTKRHAVVPSWCHGMPRDGTGCHGSEGILPIEDLVSNLNLHIMACV